MSSTELNAMHGDHREWQSENAFWHDQLREWEREVGEAIGDLPKIEQALRGHERRLQTHAAAIRLYEQVAADHEHQLAELVHEGAPSAAGCTAHKHGKESRNHAQQRQVHEALKRTHHTFMAHWAMLLEALGAVET
ncbi:MAG: hypothetical protein K8U03_23605 [Planctomycetia bacterium]|nr:hypothetical protein [Planctomycetia bacterium]